MTKRQRIVGVFLVTTALRVRAVPMRSPHSEGSGLYRKQ